TLSTTDSSTFQTFSYTLLTNTDKFTISGNTLLTNTIFYNTTQTSYDLKIKTTNTTTGLTFTETITVIVYPSTAQPTDISLTYPDSHATAGEPTGTLVGTLTTTDPNVGQSYTYVIQGANSNLFTIANNTGTLLTNVILPNTPSVSYKLTIQSTNSLGLSVTRTITATVDPTPPPQVTLSGAPVFNPAGNYVLLLASTGAGTDTIASTTVNWGDGTTTVVAGFPTALAHHYPLADSLYTITVSVTDENGTFAALNAVTADAELASQSQAFVAQLYLDLLHRDADAGGLANFTAMLDQGASPDMVVQSILASPEYKTAVVNELYLRYLGRPVDPAGLQNALPFFNVGVFGGGGEV